MQEGKKRTLIFSLIVCAFVFVAIVIFYQFGVINSLQQDLKTKNAELQRYNQLIEETNNQIELVQTDDYIEKWAKTYLNWVGEGEIEFVI